MLHGVGAFAFEALLLKTESFRGFRELDRSLRLQQVLVSKDSGLQSLLVFSIPKERNTTTYKSFLSGRFNMPILLFLGMSCLQAMDPSVCSLGFRGLGV